MTTLPGPGPTGEIGCLAVTRPDDGADAHVVCTVTTALGSLGFGRRRVPPDGRTLLVVLDAATGARAATHDLAQRLPSVAALGPDLVLAEVDPDLHVRVTRQDPVSGAVRWTVRGPDPLGGLTSATPLRIDLPRAGRVTAAGSAAGDPAGDPAADPAGVVAVSGPGAWALQPDGVLVGSWAPRRPGSPSDVDPSVDLTVLPDGRFVVGEPDAGGLDGLPYGTVSASDARDGFAVPGRVLRPVVDDGSAGDVLLTVPPGSGQVVAVDPGTGRWRWRTEARGAAVVLDGRLHTRSGGAVAAVDVGTGRTVWRTEVATRRSSRELMTDGRVLLVPTTSADGRPGLTALGLDDGRVRWSAPAPDGVEDYLVVDGGLVALTEREAVGLG